MNYEQIKARWKRHTDGSWVIMTTDREAGGKAIPVYRKDGSHSMETCQEACGSIVDHRNKTVYYLYRPMKGTEEMPRKKNFNKIDPRTLEDNTERVRYIANNSRAMKMWNYWTKRTLTGKRVEDLIGNPAKAHAIVMETFWKAAFLFPDPQTWEGFDENAPTPKADSESEGIGEGENNEEPGESEEDPFEEEFEFTPNEEDMENESESEEEPEGYDNENFVAPYWFDTCITFARLRKPQVLIGPTGSGKTHVGPELARILSEEEGKDIPFYALSGDRDIQTTDFFGYPRVDGQWVYGAFLKAFKYGGVLLLDEADALSANVALALNMALANKFMFVQGYATDRIDQHPDFVYIAAQNTDGSGANRQYCGRERQDEALKNRMACFEIRLDYDERVEKSLANLEVCMAGHVLRERCRFEKDRSGKTVARVGFPRDISTRTILDWSYLFENTDWTLEQVMYPFFSGWQPGELEKVRVEVRHDKREAEVLA